MLERGIYIVPEASGIWKPSGSFGFFLIDIDDHAIMCGVHPRIN